MQLIEIFLPLRNDPTGSEDRLLRVREELLKKFGGVTTYWRGPAEGLWKSDDQTAAKDQIVICEVMTGEIDASWWKAFRQRQEAAFDQEEILIRASEVQIL